MIEGSQESKGRIQQILEVLTDHAELASLELRFEAKQASRRLAVLAAVALLISMVVVLLHVALILGLVALGLHPAFACLVVAAADAGGAYAMAVNLGRRDPRAGSPFEQTRQELPESVEWIRKLFS